jgi:hypothetical protein
VDITLGRNDKCLDDYYSEAVGFEGQVRCMLIDPEDGGDDTLVIVTEELPKDEPARPMKLLWKGDTKYCKGLFKNMKEDDEAEKRRMAKAKQPAFGDPTRSVVVTLVVSGVSSWKIEDEETEWDPISEAYHIEFESHVHFKRWLDKCDEAADGIHSLAFAPEDTVL